jgi:predicted metalloprotease
MSEFVGFVHQQVDEMWSELFIDDTTYAAPGWAVVETGSLGSNCTDGAGNPGRVGDPAVDPSWGPAFYCPLGGEFFDGQTTDEPMIYLSGPWLYYHFEVINPANFDFAVAVVVAHEFGHHITMQLGYMNVFPVYQATSRQLELSADCLAGMWANHEYYDNQLEPGDIEEAVQASWNEGTDFPLPTGTQGDHGTRQDRVDHFMLGYDNADLEMCLPENILP